MKDGWLTAAEMAKAFDVSPQGFNKNVRSYGWRAPEKMWRPDNPQGIWRPAEEGGGYEYHESLLPSRVQAKLNYAAAPATEPTRDDAKAGAETAAMWTWFDRQPDKIKAKAKDRLSALDTVEALLRNGQRKEVAVPLVAAQAGVAVSSIWGWYARVAGKDRKDWLPFLADRYAGRTKEAEFTFEAWEAFKELYLRLEQPTMTSCYRDLQELAEKNGWTVPAEKSVARKVEREIAAPILVLRRQGPDALKRMYPPQERDRSCFHALEAINGDGHIWDVRVEWPDGEITRPVMVPFQDLYSNKILAWRVDKSENREVIRLALGDVVEQYGIPDHVWFDNTRAFANKLLTAGAKHRFRFKVRDEDPIGICEQLGMQVHFTLPYSGQSKPIERSFRDFATDISDPSESALRAWVKRQHHVDDLAFVRGADAYAVIEGLKQWAARVGVDWTHHKDPRRCVLAAQWHRLVEAGAPPSNDLGAFARAMFGIPSIALCSPAELDPVIEELGRRLRRLAA